ncbi:MAG TPA: fatty acid desaturase, partial [Coleofasciculaceae cyanobacterium]
MTHLEHTLLLPKASSTASSAELVRSIHSHSSIRGLAIALAILALWVSSWGFLFIPHLQIWWVIPAITIRTFLYTGLFITAHDAMHRSLWTGHPEVNDRIGAIAVFLYAFFDYQKLLKKHRLHHQHPASELDPDFCAHQNPLLWYFHFLKQYCGWSQLLTPIVIFEIIQYLLQVPTIHLILFWAIPALLSSIQLFYFGTFLPHREPTGGYHNLHRTQSSSFSIIWSFLTCYHFGYHEEHHQYPSLPWWQLPIIYRLRQTMQGQTPSLHRGLLFRSGYDSAPLGRET